MEQKADKPKKKKGNILGDMTYGQYINSWNWKEKSGYIKHLAGYTCERCKRKLPTGRLDVHHKNYKSIGNENQEDVEVLCRECHRKEHGRWIL